MTTEKIERILAAEEEIVPSSGFVASVMERISEESAAPPPIPFPWKRAIPGIILAGGAFAWGAYELARLGVEAVRAPSLPAIHLSVSAQGPLASIGWLALAAVVSLGSWALSRALAGRSSLF
jgi:hypothetical protein